MIYVINRANSCRFSMFCGPESAVIRYKYYLLSNYPFVERLLSLLEIAFAFDFQFTTMMDVLRRLFI